MLPASVRRPFWLGLMISAKPLALEAMTGLEQAMASRATLPKLSSKDGAAMNWQRWSSPEFDRLLEQLAGFAQSEVTRELIRNVEVVFHPARVDENLDQTAIASPLPANVRALKPESVSPAFGSPTLLLEMVMRMMPVAGS